MTASAAASTLSDLLLNYQVQSDPDPIQVNPQLKTRAGLTVTVNTTAGFVTCKHIEFQLAVGSNAKDFMASVDGVKLSPPAGWTLVQNGGTLTASADTDETGLFGRTGLVFVFGNIAVTPEPGTAWLTIEEKSAKGTAGHDGPPLNFETRRGTHALAKFPPGFEITEFTADPLIVDPGKSTTLKWQASLPPTASGPNEGSATYRLEWVASGGTQTIDHPKGLPDQPLPNDGTYQVDKVDSQTTFYLVANAHLPGHTSTQTLTRQVTVSLGAPEIVSFAPTQRPVRSQHVSLAWELNETVPTLTLTRFDARTPHGTVLTQDADRREYLDVPPTKNPKYQLTIWRNDMTDSHSIEVAMSPPVPVGTVNAWFGTDTATLPIGWLLCDGQEFSQATYPDLEPAIGNGRVPDLRGYFVRGLGGVDPDKDRAVGSIQCHQLQAHSHSFKGTGGTLGHLKFPYKLYERLGVGEPLPRKTSVEGGGDESRPVNVAAHYIIFAGYPEK